ncbi:MAG: cytochrome c oxidase subunit [Actinomycetota bacterium]|jgi:cytochrome c oxidase subunit 4|nr:cytochrome c oxidase subunit [Actinomycetota bacterium]MEA2534937.1 cytochrome c oxidase subunit [Actinomycetota bacterium]MEA2567432.1 cytochrome c oxidase subunit [Actinomycetota bacterium]
MSEAVTPPVEHAHPGPAEYIKVAVFLAVVTGIEVGIYYLKGARSVLAPALILLSIVKFSMVGLYFMHLKFDTHLFRRVFILGIVLALTVYAVALVTLLNYH